MKILSLGNKNYSVMREALFNSDKYQYTMGEVFCKTHKEGDMAVFDFFFRKAPDGNNWAVVSGTNEVIELIRLLNGDAFTRTEKMNLLYPIVPNMDYVQKLCDMKFTGSIYAMREGEIAFPNQPIITVKAPMLEAIILETPLLSIMNHQCNVATKASRCYRAAVKNGVHIPILAFGSRRAHGPWSAIFGDKAAYIGGCASISNIMTENLFNIKSVGTMSHAFVESYGKGKQAEYEAFNDFTKHSSGAAILLIDTFNVLKSGLPNAIKIFKEFKLEESGRPYGIRLDSGDLAYLSKQCRAAFKEAGLTKAQIILTNGLDEYLVKDLLDQDAEVDSFGIGDAIATSKDNPCFGGVYKLVKIKDEAVIKLSEDTIKISNPNEKITYRLYSQANDEALADVTCLAQNDPLEDLILLQKEITLRAETDRFKTMTLAAGSYYFMKLQKTFIENGAFTDYSESPEATDVKEFKNYFLNNLKHFSTEHTRLVNPHEYKVDISDALYDLKQSIIKEVIDSLNE